jgi:hypothetical protein
MPAAVNFISLSAPTYPISITLFNIGVVTGSIKWPLRPLYGSNAPFIVMILSLELDLLAPNFRFHFPDYRDEEGTKLDG